MPVTAVNPVNATFQVGSTVYAIDAESGANYTRTLGMQPNHNEFNIAYTPGMTLPNVGDVGTLTLRDGLLPEGIISFTQQIVDDVDFADSPSGGQVVTVVVKDIRERSQRGSITGEYNQPRKGLGFDDDGIPDQGTLENLENPKTLRQLIDLCFTALGLSADTTLLAGVDEHPAVSWSFDNPAGEIDRLLNEYGYAVSLAANDIFVVVRLGVMDARHGPFVSDVPNEHASTRTTSTGLSPDTIVVGERIVIEETRPFLIPVGLDINGEIKPLDELSYFRVTPDPANPGQNYTYGGFQKLIDNDDPSQYIEDPVLGNIIVPTIQNEPHDKTLERVRAAASASIWKMYRLADEHLWKLPLLSKIAQTRADILTGKPYRRDPIVEIAEYRNEHVDFNGNLIRAGNMVEPEEIEDGYSIDFERGIVRFSKARVRVYELTIPGSNPPQVVSHTTFPQVRLTCAWKSALRITTDPDGLPLPPARYRQQVREVDHYFFPANANLQNCQKLRHPELVLYAQRDANDVDHYLNLGELDEFSQGLIDKYLWSNQAFIQSGSAKVPRILPYECDGLVRQLTWRVDGSDGASTTAEANRERPIGPDPIYQEKLHTERVNRVIRQVEGEGGGNRRGRNVQPNDVPTTQPVHESPVRTSQRPASASVINVSNVSAPAFAFMEIEAGDSRDARKLKVRRPLRASESGTQSRGIVVSGKPLTQNGGSGSAAIGGLVCVRCDEEVQVGDQIGPDRSDEGDPFIGIAGGGPYRVIEKPEPTIALIRLETPSSEVVLVQAHGFSSHTSTSGRVVDASVLSHYVVPANPPGGAPPAGRLVPTGEIVRLMIPSGATAFPGAVGLATRYPASGFSDSGMLPAQYPSLIAAAGEFFGFPAIITGSGDVNNKYPWTLDVVQTGLLPIGEAVNRPESYMPTVNYATPLGRAFNLPSVTYHTAKITNRRIVPVSMPVWMRYSERLGSMVFDVFQDPNYAC